MSVVQHVDFFPNFFSCAFYVYAVYKVFPCFSLALFNCSFCLSSGFAELVIVSSTRYSCISSEWSFSFAYCCSTLLVPPRGRLSSSCPFGTGYRFGCSFFYMLFEEVCNQIYTQFQRDKKTKVSPLVEPKV
jgi:hypothetical protein